MSGLTTIMLLSPGSVLDALWRLNPQAQKGFAAIGAWALALMVVVCTACVVAAVGLWRCRHWGFWTALGILGVNLAGDTASVFIAHHWNTLVGLPIGACMIFYLLRQRRVFHP